MATTNYVTGTVVTKEWLNDADALIYEGNWPATVVPKTDTISEETSAAGITIDGVLLKDSQVNTDQINEKTTDAGVTVDGVLLKDSQVSTNVVNELTATSGVTIDSVLLKDNTVTATTLTANTSVVTDTISEKTAAAGVTIDGVLLKDNAISASGNILSTAGTVKGTKNSQSGYSSSGLMSESTSGDVHIGLSASGSTAVSLGHVRGGNGIRILDSANNTANIVGKELFATPASGNAQFTATNPSAEIAYFGIETGGSAYLLSTAATDPVYIGVNSVAQLFVGTTGTYPTGNGTKELGLSTNRWSVVYAANGTIQTSDKREKVELGTVTNTGSIIDALRPVKYKWKEGGKDDIGFHAQEVYALVPEAVHPPETEDGLWGFQPDRLIPFLVAEIQDLRRRVDALEKAKKTP